MFCGSAPSRVTRFSGRLPDDQANPGAVNSIDTTAQDSPVNPLVTDSVKYANNSAMRFRTLLLSLLAILLCSCAVTSVKSTWKSPHYQGGPVTKVAVLVIEERGMLRQGFENRFINQLRQGGETAIPTFDLLSLPEIKEDKAGAAERLKSAGAEGVIVLRLMDLATYYREIRPGSERYAEMITGYENYMWYDYYSIAYMDMSPTYGSLEQKVYLETSLFDLKSGKRLWSGVTESTFKDRVDRMAEMDVIVAKFLAAMRKDGVVL